MNPAALKALASGDFENAVVASTPGGIEAQEARGQQTFCASDILPKEVYGHSRAGLEAIGFVFGEDHDELFVKAKLPEGWTKRATEHSMHSEIVDAQGRVRATIFYKAAFYDRRAHMSLSRRFRYSGYEDGSSEAVYRCCVFDGVTAIKEFGEHSRDDYEGREEVEKQARAWLDTEYPDWQDATKYWG